jgi:hypothetical protein
MIADPTSYHVNGKQHIDREDIRYCPKKVDCKDWLQELGDQMLVFGRSRLMLFDIGHESRSSEDTRAKQRSDKNNANSGEARLYPNQEGDHSD